MRPSERHTLDYPPPSGTASMRRNRCRRCSLARSPHAGEIRTRELLGIPVAMTDYCRDHGRDGRHDRARGARLGLRRRRARRDGRAERSRDAARAARLDAHGPRRHAARLGREHARRAPGQPRLRPRADVALQRPLRRARATASGCTAAATRARSSSSPCRCGASTRGSDRRRLLASVPRPHRGGGDGARRADQRAEARRPLGRHRRAQAGEVDGAHARAARRAGACARVGAAFDFHAGRISQAPRLDAGPRPRVDLPDRAGAAPAAAALPLLQPALPGRVRAAARRASAAGRSPPRLRPCQHASPSSGLGRIGLPLALSLRRPRLRGHRRRPRARRARPRSAAAGCRSRRPAPRSCSSACSPRTGSSSASRSRTRAAPTTSSSRSARPRSRRSRSTCPRSASWSTTCCRSCARARRSSCARPSAPGTTEWLAGYLEQLRGFQIGDDLFVAHVPERIAVEPLPRGDRDACRRSSAASARSRAERAARPVRGLRRVDRAARPRCRPSWRRSGRTSSATRRSRSRTC